MDTNAFKAEIFRYLYEESGIPWFVLHVESEPHDLPEMGSLVFPPDYSEKIPVCRLRIEPYDATNHRDLEWSESELSLTVSIMGGDVDLVLPWYQIHAITFEQGSIAIVCPSVPAPKPPGGLRVVK